MNLPAQRSSARTSRVAPAGHRLPPRRLAFAEAFFGEAFDDLTVRVGGFADRHGAAAAARGATLHFAPGRFDPNSPGGLALIGHELAHVVQQRRGRVAPWNEGDPLVLEDEALEADADVRGSEFAAFCATGRLPARRHRPAPRPGSQPRFPLQRNAWLRRHDLKPADEYFWHATTTTNVRRIFESSSIKAVGTGGNGLGFYVAPRITDYIKVMAYRNLRETDWDSMFILKILARDFYGMDPYFSDDGLAGQGGAEADAKDFVAARWSAEIVGDTGYRDPDDQPTRYNQYQRRDLPVVGFNPVTKTKDFESGVGWRAKAAARKSAMDTLWECAKTCVIPDATPENLKLLMNQQGIRDCFLNTIEEITFKSSACDKLFVVGARLFQKNTFLNDTECTLEHVEAVISLD